MHDIFLQNFLKAFVAIDPISLIPLFAVITADLDREKIIRLAFLMLIITSIVLTFFSIYGNIFLFFMGISLNSFKIVGGLFLLFISFEMVFEKRIERKKNLAMPIIDDNQVSNLAVFPISIPLVAGPSAITLSVLISKDYQHTFIDFYQQIFPIFLTLFITSLILLFSNFIFRILNKTIILTLQKICGLILGALSVEYIINGIRGFL